VAETVGNLAVIITATDKATATIGRVRDSLDTALEPTRQLHAAFNRLGEVSNLSRVGGWIGAATGQARTLASTLSSAAFPLAAGGLAASAAAMATSFVTAGKGLLEGSRSLGMSVEDLGAFRNAARLAGLSADEAQGGLERFDAVLTDAAFGRNPAAVAASQMEVLGFAIRDADGKARSGADALGDLAEAYAKLNHDPNAQEELARIWGVEALDKFLRRGREGVAELLRQGRARGVLSEEEAKQAKRLSQNWDSMLVSADRLTMSVGLGMAPSLLRASNAMDELTRAHGAWLGERAGAAVEEIVVSLADMVRTGRELYTEYQRLSTLPWFRWFFDLDRAGGGNGRWWNPFGPIGSLPPDQGASAPERLTGLASGPARRRANDYVEPGPPPRDLLGLIGRAEGTDRGRGYNETLGYGAFTNGPQNLTGMTLDQIDQLQARMLRHPGNTLNSSAVGRFQITQTTLRGLRRELGLTGSERYDEAMQDRLATALAERRGLRAFQQGGISAAEFQARLAQEWASIPDPRTGQGFYMNQRRPGVDQGTISQVLEQARQGPAGNDPTLNRQVVPPPSAVNPVPVLRARPAASDGSEAPAPLSLLQPGAGGRVSVDVRFANAPQDMTVNTRADGGAEVSEVRVERGMMDWAAA
jgi:muramidase (phage lysozyme)